MIGYDEIAVACSYLDAISDKGEDFGDIVAERHIDIEGLTQAAEQRALRIAAILAGQDPRDWPRTRKSRIELPVEFRRMIQPLQLAFVDGFMAGHQVHDPDDRIQRFPQPEDQ